MLFFYNLSLRLYVLILRLAALFHPKAKYFVAGRQGWRRRLKQALGPQQERPVIWMHCASLGEFEQGRPVLEAIREQFPDFALLLTFFSPSGYELRKDYDGADWVFYLPVDGRSAANDFLEIVKPTLALFVKYEFWYYYLQGLKKRQVPTILFSAYFQQNQPFFKSYGGLFRKMLQCYQQIFVQDEASFNLLVQIGVQQVQIVGDTRFDRASKVLTALKSFPNVLAFRGTERLLVAGSTWPEDEVLLKNALPALMANGYKILLVPHETGASHIRRLMHLFGENACLWNDDERILATKAVAVVNTVGHLSYLYQYADVAWIGGGFGKGIHNIIEPAVFGIPVFFGPKFQRFREAKEMIALNAVASLTDAKALTDILQHETALKAMGINAHKYVHAQLGATQKIINYLLLKCLRRTS